MSLEQFWAVVGESRRGFDPNRKEGNMDQQLDELRTLLSGMSPVEIAAFRDHFVDRQIEAYRWDLWRAAELIAGGCSDDGFTDFRSWLISMGRGAYENALRNPDSLAGPAAAPGVEDVFFEPFQYVAGEVYEEKEGEPIPENEVEYPDSPAGDEWPDTPEELRQRFPKLWGQFGDRSA